MGREVDIAVREDAAALYIVDGLTYEQTAQRMGVSVGALKKWSEADGWRGKRDEYRKSLREIRANTLKLRKGLLTKALGSLDPQDVYAVSRLEAAAQRCKPNNEAPAALPGELRKIETKQDAIQALTEAVELKVNAMLTRPEALNLAAIKDMKKALELLQEMERTYAAEKKEGRETAQPGLSVEAVEQIRSKILGVTGP